MNSWTRGSEINRWSNDIGKQEKRSKMNAKINDLWDNVNNLPLVLKNSARNFSCASDRNASLFRAKASAEMLANASLSWR